MTQNCEKCCVAVFAEVEVVVEAGREVDDGDEPLVSGVEEDAGGRVEVDIEVDGGETVPISEVDT